jgi:hypothetical protein
MAQKQVETLRSRLDPANSTPSPSPPFDSRDSTLPLRVVGVPSFYRWQSPAQGDPQPALALSIRPPQPQASPSDPALLLPLVLLAGGFLATAVGILARPAAWRLTGSFAALTATAALLPVLIPLCLAIAPAGWLLSRSTEPPVAPASQP